MFIVALVGRLERHFRWLACFCWSVSNIISANRQRKKEGKKERKNPMEEETTQREKKELMLPKDAHLESLPHVHEEQKSSKKVRELAGKKRIEVWVKMPRKSGI